VTEPLLTAREIAEPLSVPESWMSRRGRVRCRAPIRCTHRWNTAGERDDRRWSKNWLGFGEAERLELTRE